MIACAAERAAGPRHYRRRSVLIAGGAVALLTAIATAGPALVISADVGQPEAIVSLASHEWERLPVAAGLALKYPEARVLLTLPPAVTRHRCHQCGQRVDYFVSQGVAADRVDVLPLAESSTRGEARAVRDFVRERNLRRVLIVTSAYHTRRALWTFRRTLGSGVTVGVTPAAVYQFASPNRWWSRPYDRWYVSYESAALMRDAARHLMGN